ncbi:MAG TPA: hypothetical protein VK774_10825, partial [Solirubrobacteraceae bacterium]|nr:hypothetical protein [Solirubrobacteraceae bacterium]
HSNQLAPSHSSDAAVSTVRWQRDVPDAIRSLGALADADYEDIVTASAHGLPSRTPDEWVQAGFKGVPRGVLVLTPFVQRVFLGLRLKLRPAPDRLLGWQIADRGENWLRIEAESWFLTGHVVMHADDERLSFASFIRYDRWLGKIVWPPVSLIHRQVALTLVRSAMRAQ